MWSVFLRSNTTKRLEAQLMRFLHCFNKCTLHAQSQTPSASAKTCGLNFHRLGLPQYSSVHTPDHRESDLLTAVQKCFLFWAQPHPPRSCCPSSVLAIVTDPFNLTPKTNKPSCFVFSLSLDRVTQRLY